MTVEKCPQRRRPGIMNIEDAKRELQSEREAYWAHLTDPKLKALKRRIQNRINKYVSRWKTFFYLDTAEDYHILACEIQDMREGRAKRREGRPRRPEDRSTRRTSQRLANKRQKPNVDVFVEDNLINSGIDFDFDHLDNTLPAEEDVIDNTETTTNHSSVTSSSDEFAHNLSNEIDRTSDCSSSNLFNFCNTHILSQHSNMPLLADETWCHSDNMNGSSTNSGLLYPRTNIASDRWIGSLQQDICDGNSMNFEWQGNLPSFNESHDLIGIGENWSGLNSFVSESYEQVIQPVVHDKLKSASSGFDGGVETQSSVALLPPETISSGMQPPKRLDEAQLYMLVTELRSQLHERRKNAFQIRPVLPLAERDDLAPLIELCLTTLREPDTCMSRNNEVETRREDSRTAKRYGVEMEMMVTYLWDALRVESCRKPSSIT